MKHARLFLVVAVLAVLGACTHIDLKSPCAGCDDGIKSRVTKQV
jgi:hypothetical protein